MRLVAAVLVGTASAAGAAPDPLASTVDEMARAPDRASKPIEPSEPGARWRIAIAVRAAATLPAGAEPSDRVGVVPAIGVRVERAIGPILIGGHLAAGAPAWYGEHEAALSIDTERVLRERAGAVRISIGAGFDAGVALLFYDAPPETSSPDALEYWGPLVRARAQLHVLWPTPNGSRIGFVAGGGIAISDAHYIDTADGDGTRVEPSAEVGLELRL